MGQQDGSGQRLAGPGGTASGTLGQGMASSGRIGQDNARLDDTAGLASYFRAFVILGPGAFVETALGFADYEDAMVRKLLRELEGVSVALATPVRSGTGD